MSEAVRLGDILPAVMRDIEKRTQNAQLQSNRTEESVVSQLRDPVNDGSAKYCYI